MIKTRLMWELYTFFYTRKKEKADKTYKEVSNRLNNIKHLIVPYKNIINKYLSVKFKDLKYLKLTEINKITYPHYEVIEDSKIVNFKSILFYIDKYVKLKYELLSAEKKVKEIETYLISHTIFNYVINRFNTLIITEIVKNNFRLRVNGIFGIIQIVKNENSRLRINWGESNKNKKKIIKEGKILYYKKDDTGKDYKGVPWLVYFPRVSYRIAWHRSRKLRRAMPTASAYNLKVSKYKISLLGMLTEEIQDPLIASERFTTTLNDIQNESIPFDFEQTINS